MALYHHFLIEIQYYVNMFSYLCTVRLLLASNMTLLKGKNILFYIQYTYDMGRTNTAKCQQMVRTKNGIQTPYIDQGRLVNKWLRKLL